MKEFRVVVDGHPEGFMPLKLESDGDVDLTRLATVDLAGVPFVKLGDWWVSRNRIVAFLPEEAKERERAGFAIPR
ncbi:MAG TPA: hypothetical protein VFQ22_12065 [Longimicrobiales bacterium]|nr:hypothetical protein [Longimicrobiales bacterium]